MSILSENLKLIRDLTGLSQTKFATRINAELPKDKHFNKTQVHNYENEISEPDTAFKSRVAEIAGITIADLQKKLSVSQIRIKKESAYAPDIKDAGSMLVQNQWVIMATQNVILSILAEVQATYSPK